MVKKFKENGGTFLNKIKRKPAEKIREKMAKSFKEKLWEKINSKKR